MSSWDTLPTEIITEIAKGIESPKDIAQFQLTCKRWASFAQQRLYADIEFATERQLRAFIENIMANPYLGLLVGQLDISHVSHLFKFMDYFTKAVYRPPRLDYFAILTEYHPKPLDCFTKLTEYCPNVKQILKTDRFDEGVWQLLIEALQEGKWRQLHLIKPPTASPGNLVYYGKAVWEIRDRLTELQISDELRQIVAWSGQDMGSSHSVAEKILAFPKVRDLTLIKKNSHMHISDFNEHIDNCASLKKLTVHCFPPHSYPVKNSRFRKNRMLSDIPTIKQQHAVKQLHAYLPLFCDDDSLVYIMHKFPSLSVLKLDSDGVLNPDCSYDVSRKFLVYASKIRYINIQLERKNVCELLSMTFKDRIKFDKKKILLMINYGGSSRNGNLDFLCIETERNYRNPMFKVNMISTNSNPIKSFYNIRINLASSKHYAGSALPHVTLIENLGNEITSLHIDCKTKGDVFTNITGGYFLDHILANCSQLEHLVLNGASLVHCSPTLPTKKQLNTLFLTICDIYPGIFEELSPLLLSLESLRLDKCKFIYENGQQLREQSCLVISMPHTSIDCLHLSTRNRYNSFSVKVKIHDKREMYYAMAKLDYFPVLLTGPQAESIYRLKDKYCFKMDLECFSLRLIYVMLSPSYNVYGIDCLKNRIVL
jgi:hypothetical protein